MKSVKVVMTEKNYLRIANTHIFINFTKHNMDYLSMLRPGSIRKIHIFITNHASINETLRFLLKRATSDQRILIHIPKSISELNAFLHTFIGEEEEGKYTSIIEKEPFIFGSELDDFKITIRFNKTELKVQLSPFRTDPFKPSRYGIEFPNYPYNGASEEEQGIFENVEMRIDPMKFKDQLITAFKKNCPEGILKSFKTDDEIMEYIMQQGEWAVKEEEQK